MRSLVLASTSRYRRRLLEQLGVPFSTFDPQVDETRSMGESIEACTVRLAVRKAQSGIQHFPDALVIGSDQLCTLDGQISGKPGTPANVSTPSRSSGP